MVTGSPPRVDTGHGSQWRDAGNYAFVKALPSDGCAWEFLRRNPNYQKAWRAFCSQGNPLSEANPRATVLGLVSFESPERDARSARLFWTPASLPSVIPLISLPAELADPNRKQNTISFEPMLAQYGPARLIQQRGVQFRLHILDGSVERASCVVLPLDQHFAIRAAAAIRLWRCLTGRSLRRDLAEMPIARRERLVLALRALDGRLEQASYRDIGAALFGGNRMPARGWKTHDIRDRTVRLARLGFSLMAGGYRRLLCYPFRGRS